MKTVLLVDDDKDFRSLLATVLRSFHLKVLEAGNRAAAENQLAHVAADLVLVDGLLPDGDAVPFIEALRARDEAVRIVFASGFRRELSLIHRLTKELDVSLLIYKPVVPEELARQIVQLLEARQVSSGLGQHALGAELEALWAQFAAKLPDKLRELASAIARARIDPAAISLARGLAHKLRGSAGSYGHAALGEAAAVAEDLLAEAEAHPLFIRRYLWAEVDEAMREAELCLKRSTQRDRPDLELPATPEKALLVVDDDLDFLQLVRQVGRKLSIPVIAAQSAEEALQRANQCQLLGAMLDVHIAGETSYSLARALRGTRGNSDIPIAFASADRSIETRVAAIEAGATRFFEKPMSEESFTTLAHQLVALSEVAQGRVLIVDDDPDVVAHYTSVLRRAGICVDALDSADTITEKLDEVRPDVLLLDIQLPRVSGLDVCRALRMSHGFELLPILIVTAQTDDHTRLQAFRAGASDVVAKPPIPEELLARVGVQIERMRLLRERADKDALTGLLLRRAFIEALQRSLALAARDSGPLSLVLLDIDRFKVINDSFGHLAGDQVLAATGDLLRRRFRMEDLRGRWGGEEFMLVFPGQDADFAERAANRLLRDFSELRFSSDGGEPFSATFTAGVASYPADGTSITALVRRADERLYAGKQRGRNQVVADPQSGR